jgi:hypothetical protein
VDLSEISNGSYTLTLRSNEGAVNVPVVIAR